MLKLFKSATENTNPISRIPKGWLVREIAQDPIDRSWSGMLYKFCDGEVLYVQDLACFSFESLIDSLVGKTNSDKDIISTKED